MSSEIVRTITSYKNTSSSSPSHTRTLVQKTTTSYTVSGKPNAVAYSNNYGDSYDQPTSRSFHRTQKTSTYWTF